MIQKQSAVTPPATTKTMSDYKRRDRLKVETPEHDEPITVYNWANVAQPAVIHGSRSIEYFELEIGAGDSRVAPDYITPWLAEDIHNEYTVDVEDKGIEVIDPTDEEVTVL